MQKTSILILLAVSLIFSISLNQRLALFAQDIDREAEAYGMAPFMRDVKPVVVDSFYKKHSRWPSNNDIQEIRDIAQELVRNGNKINLNIFKSIEFYPQQDGSLKFICFVAPADYPDSYPSSSEKISKIVDKNGQIRYELFLRKTLEKQPIKGEPIVK